MTDNKILENKTLVGSIILITVFILLLIIVGMNNDLTVGEKIWIDNNKQNMSISCTWLKIGEYIKSNRTDVPSCNALEHLVNNVCGFNFNCVEAKEYCICEE